MKEWIKQLAIYEPGKPIEEVARELGFDEVADIIKVASNENEFGPSPQAITAMSQAIHEMHRYPDGGTFYLKEKLARTLEVEPTQLIFGNGSNELIVFLAHLFLEPGRALVMSEHAFAVYALATHLYQGELIQVPMKAYTHDLDSLREAITENTRIVVIVNPNNPTGTAVDPIALREFILSLPEDVLAVVDEAYYELMPQELRADLLSLIREGQENLIILRTFSKGYGLAGLRIGYAIGHEKLISQLNRVRQPFNVNAMAQAAAMAALDDHAHLNKTAIGSQQGLYQLTRGLHALGIEAIPSAANFLLAKVGDGQKYVKALERRKVIVRPMDGYGLPEFIRISVGTEKQNEQVLEQLKAVQEDG